MFVDIDENTPLLDCISHSFMYEELKSKTKAEVWLTKQVQYVSAERTNDTQSINYLVVFTTGGPFSRFPHAVHAKLVNAFSV